jgi:hypothetical protein
MDFLTTAQLLMDMRERIGPFHHRFDENGLLQIELRVDENVPQMFEDAQRLFEPA